MCDRRAESVSECGGAFFLSDCVHGNTSLGGKVGLVLATHAMHPWDAKRVPMLAFSSGKRV
jgi:hypothetical protein